MHKNKGDLLKELENVKVKVGQQYYHFKDSQKIYTVINIGFLESTEEIAVMYKGDDNIVWVRNLDNFLDSVDFKGQKVKRFSLIGNFQNI